MHASRRSCSFLCWCLLTVSLLGCGPGTSGGPPHLASHTSPAPLTGVDWANFTYFSSCYGNIQPFKAKNGRARNDHVTFEVFPPAFGDLTGDGQPEAALPYRCSAVDKGGIQVFVYSGTAAHPRLLGQLPLSRPSGGVPVFNSLEVQIHNEQIQLTGTSYSAAAPRCCPDRSLSLWYRWNGSQFVTVRSTDTPLALHEASP
jgi:hypothetical protein